MQRVHGPFLCTHWCCLGRLSVDCVCFQSGGKLLCAVAAQSSLTASLASRLGEAALRTCLASSVLFLGILTLCSSASGSDARVLASLSPCQEREAAASWACCYLWVTEVSLSAFSHTLTQVGQVSS